MNFYVEGKWLNDLEKPAPSFFKELSFREMDCEPELHTGGSRGRAVWPWSRNEPA